MTMLWAVFFMAGVLATPGSGVLFICSILSLVLYILGEAAFRPDRKFTPGRPLHQRRFYNEGALRFFLPVSTSLLILMHSSLSAEMSGASRSADKFIGTPGYAAIKHGGPPASGFPHADRSKDRTFAGGIISRMREYSKRTLENRGLSVRCRQLLKTLLLADRRGLDEKLTEIYRFLGISHFLALSGLHLGMLALPAGWILSRIRLPVPVRNTILIFVLAAYTRVAGSPASMLRALALFITWNSIRTLGIPADLTGCLLTGSLFLVIWKHSLIYSTGFQLSFLAVMGISLIAVPMIRNMERYLTGRAFGHLLKRFLSIPTVTFSVQLFTLPLVLQYFGRVSSAAFTANLAMIGPVTIFLYSGFLFGGLIQCPLPYSKTAQLAGRSTMVHPRVALGSAGPRGIHWNSGTLRLYRRLDHPIDIIEKEIPIEIRNLFEIRGGCLFYIISRFGRGIQKPFKTRP